MSGKSGWFFTEQQLIQREKIPIQYAGSSMLFVCSCCKWHREKFHFLCWCAFEGEGKGIEKFSRTVKRDAAGWFGSGKCLQGGKNKWVLCNVNRSLFCWGIFRSTPDWPMRSNFKRAFKANSPRNSSFSRARTQRVFTRRSTRKGNFKASDCATLLLRFNEEREKKDGKQIVVSKCITCCCCKVQAIRIWVVVNFCIFRNIVLRMLRFRLGIYLFPLFHIRAAEAKAMKMRSTLNGLETMRRASLKISDFFPIKLHLRIMFLLSARLSRS